MSELMTYLNRAVTDQASDIFLVAGGPVSLKLEGRICPIDEKRLLPPDTQKLITQIYSLANRSMDVFEKTGDDDFSFAVNGLARFRVNAYRQRNSMAAVVRIVSFDIPLQCSPYLFPVRLSRNKWVRGVPIGFVVYLLYPIH